jgi:propionate CoA-transferase
VLYVTERAVFRLTRGGVQLIEVAEGSEMRQHVLERMRFAPLIGMLKPMPLD